MHHNENEEVQQITEETPIVNEVVVEEPKAEEPVAEEAVPVVQEQEIITTPNSVSSSEPVEASLGNDSPTGAFATTAKKAAKKAPAKPEKSEVDGSQVVIFSEKNIYFPGTGKITYGFNIVSAKQAEVYLKHKSVREATPDELARKYSK